MNKKCMHILVHIHVHVYAVQINITCTYIKLTGRSSMKQYMPMKPVKRGFKVWVRADSVMGYFCDFNVYVGKPSDGTTTEVGLGERVVLQLSASLRGGNYQLFCDNYFTSCQLLETLLSHQLYCCGTTRTHRRDFPNTLKGVALERGSHLFCQEPESLCSVLTR